MDRERLHDQHVPWAPTADKDGAALDGSIQVPFGESAMAVRADDNLQRSIVIGAAINEEAQRQHVLQDADRRLDVDDAALDAPGTITFDVGALLDGNSPVLMPGDRPIRGGTLVEEQYARRPRGVFRLPCRERA